VRTYCNVRSVLTSSQSRHPFDGVQEKSMANYRRAPQGEQSGSLDLALESRAL